jgi:hypothetical protein
MKTFNAKVQLSNRSKEATDDTTLEYFSGMLQERIKENKGRKNANSTLVSKRRE